MVSSPSFFFTHINHSLYLFLGSSGRVEGGSREGIRYGNMM